MDDEELKLAFDNIYKQLDVIHVFEAAAVSELVLQLHGKDKFDALKWLDGMHSQLDQPDTSKGAQALFGVVERLIERKLNPPPRIF